MVNHNDPAAIGASVAFTPMPWQLLDMRAAPPRGWWIRTFVETVRKVEGDRLQYRSRSPHVQYAGPAWRFVADQVDQALAAGTDTRSACDHCTRARTCSRPFRPCSPHVGDFPITLSGNPPHNYPPFPHSILSS
jgi:hypothetical protein